MCRVGLSRPSLDNPSIRGECQADGMADLVGRGLERTAHVGVHRPFLAEAEGIRAQVTAEPP